ncbi:MAG: 5'/3'-nucleotidase SurE [Bacteroidales bacterium]|nr:5'/3'-nucleotidase SurE [Bacteroidales bacterium]
MKPVEEKKERLILITNDDGFQAKGLKALIELVKPLGEVVVIAPTESRSGMSHAITVKDPIRVKKIIEEPNYTMQCCSGTPVDCVKLAINTLLDRKPDLILSGINHGSNSSASILYSGTMAAALEGCLNGIPSIGFSLLDYSPDAEFKGTAKYISEIIDKALNSGMPSGTCLNVNFPKENSQDIKGVMICRQTRGVWIEEFDKRTDPQEKTYYWLTGEFKNLEPSAVDTDEWALKNNYVSIVPVQTDFTSYQAIDHFKQWNLS